jgi:7,8-dihydropterin-6-yl-methyl-4-(beta-D-ribofuranosyl)aminobenzene 5'-phosphate synthase
MDLKEKGLVVISGCAHSGIINTIRYATKITQNERVHAVLGGFHLAGPGCEAKTEKTIRELKQLNPEIIIPMHCSSWYSIVKMYRELPDSFILNSVGTMLRLG